MSCDKRILYMDYYDNGVKCANVGFVKVSRWKKRGEINLETIRMQLCITDLPFKELIVGSVKLVQHERELDLEQIKIIDGRGMMQIGDLSEKLEWDEKTDPYKEIMLRVDFAGAGHMECVLQASRNLSEQNCEILDIVDAAVKVEMTEELKTESCLMEPEVMTASEENDESETEERKILQTPQKMERMKHNKWKQLEVSLPHIRPFEDEREYLKMDINDMTLLPDMYYRLVDNSFLLHGYFNYGHLILTKINKRENEKVHLGVPGNYYEKEAQVAVMFGFESFESAGEPPQEGDFGYYMIGVRI